MIVPRIHKLTKSSQPIVEREGILIDWEGARALPSSSNTQLNGPESGPSLRLSIARHHTCSGSCPSGTGLYPCSDTVESLRRLRGP